MGRGAIHQPDFINHPIRGQVVRDPASFFELTSRTDYIGNTVPIPTGFFGENVKFRVPNKGIVSELRLEFELTCVTSAWTSASARDKWPHNFVKRLQVNANGSSVVNASGLDLHILRQMMTESCDFVDIETTALPTGIATTQVRFQIVVPLCTDPASLMGAIFAESDDTYLEVDIQFESQTELMAEVMTDTWTGSIVPTYTSWEVPHVSVPALGGQMAAVVPDLGVIAMINSHDTFINANGEQRVKISQATGELLRVHFGTFDASAYSYLSPLTSYNSVQLRYGQNQVLRKNRPRDLMLQNARWHRDILAKSHLAYDLVAENSLRDVIPPDQVLDLEVVLDIGSGVAIAGGDYIHTCEQAVLRSPVWANATPLPGA